MFEVNINNILGHMHHMVGKSALLGIHLLLDNAAFAKLMCIKTDSCKGGLLFDAGMIILHYIKGGIYNSETAGEHLTTSIKGIVVEMSDTPLKQIFSRKECAMCCIMTPAAAASRWEIVLMFFHNCHSSASSGFLKNFLTAKHVVMHREIFTSLRKAVKICLYRWQL